MSKPTPKNKTPDPVEDPHDEQGFWAIEVEPGKTFKQSSKSSMLHITHASLGVNAKDRNVLLNNNLPICVLNAGKDEHTALDLRFVPDQTMSFSVSGLSSITVSGYYEPFTEDDDDLDDYIMDQAHANRFAYDDDEDEDEGDDMEEDEDNIEAGKKGVLLPSMGKMSIENEGEDSDQEDDKPQFSGNNKKRTAPNADKNQGPANKKAKQEGGAPKNISTPAPNKQGGNNNNKQPQQGGKGGDESNKKHENKKGGIGNEKKEPQGNKANSGPKPNPNAQKGYNDNPQNSKKKNKKNKQKQGNK